MATKSCQDHLGNSYISINEMCKHYGVCRSTYENRLLRGWTQEMALTCKNHDSSKRFTMKHSVKDHLGNEYVSISEMCRAYGITDKIYWARKRVCKWDLEKILTTPLQDPEAPKNANSITCNGIEFKSVNALCKHYNIPRSTFKLRLKQGYTPEEAVKIKPQKTKGFNKKDTTCIDPWGNVFKSQAAMYRHYGTTKDIATGRFEHGWTLEQVLLNPEKIDPRKECIGPKGEKHASFKDMAEAYGLTEATLRGRLQQNYTLEDALLNWDENHQYEDHRHNKFKCKTDMYTYWAKNTQNIYPHTKRKEKLNTILERINISVLNKKLKTVKIIKRINGSDYYTVEIDNVEYIWSKDQIWEEYHKTVDNLLLKEIS